MVQLRLAPLLAVATLALGVPAAAHGAVTVTLTAGQLDVLGNGADDVIDVRATADGSITAAGSAFPRRDVGWIRILSGGGADTITIGPGIGRRVVVNGGNGSDAITGSDGDETFAWIGSAGSDTLDGGGGDDDLQAFGGSTSEHLALQPAATPGRLTLTDDVSGGTLDLTRIRRLSLSMGDGDDVFDAGAGVAAVVPFVEVNGDQGADTVNGGDEADTIVGGAGVDTLAGGGGDDRFPVAADAAAADADAIDGGPGDDVLAVVGTPLRDGFSVTAPSAGQVSVNVDGSDADPAGTVERVAIDGGAGDDEVRGSDVVPLTATGGDGDDVLTAGSAADRLDGGAGDDVLTGLGGDDVLLGGPGTDALAGGDGADHFACAGFGDTFDATAADVVDADCLPPLPPEPPGPPARDVVVVPGPAVPGPVVPGPPTYVVEAVDRRAPVVALRGVPATITRAALLKSGLRVRVAVDERAALSGELLSTARSARIAAAAPNLTLATRTAPLAAAAGTRTLTLKPARGLVGRAKRFTLTVRVTATDAAGNRRTATKRVKVR